MNVPRFAGFLFAEHDDRVCGNIRKIEVLDGLVRAARTLRERRKGHSQESHDNKCKHIFHLTFSFDNNAKKPLQGFLCEECYRGLYVVNSLYAFSCEISTNYACGCIFINLRVKIVV